MDSGLVTLSTRACISVKSEDACRLWTV